MTLLEEHGREIELLCVRYKVKQLYAFGSVLTERFKENSGIDLIVDFQLLDPFAYTENYFSLKFGLENILKRKIDLLEAQEIHNPFFKKAVDSQRRLLYAA
jgi:predicted nucleotidyltransferase